MATKTLALNASLQKYLRQHSVTETPLLKALREETQATLEAAPMQISPEQGQFFRFLLELMGATRVWKLVRSRVIALLAWHSHCQNTDMSRVAI